MRSGRLTSIRERPHRLPKEAYIGRVTTAITACVADRRVLFDEPDVVAVFVSALGHALERCCCSAPVYCFMPDHLHVIVQGNTERSDTRGAFAMFKQDAGFWLRRHCPDRAWQKDFWDHILRSGEDLGEHVRYIAENPVRTGLVCEWTEYPFTGAIGYDLREVLADTAVVLGR